MGFFDISKVAFTILTFSLILSVIAAEGPICSVADPDDSKLCISVKFPWKSDPVYFCTEKTNLNYTSQCEDVPESHCHDDDQNDTLKIATPWDCCPYVSTPDPCSRVACAPKPFNRTCKEIKRRGQCCPTYFCDEGELSSCKLKRMKPSCFKGPEDKGNGTSYRDPYGCCVKFERTEDQKPGNCFGTSNAVSNSTQVKGTKISRGSMGTLFIKYELGTGVEMKCIGDRTCPDDMKCCPQNTYNYGVYPVSTVAVSRDPYPNPGQAQETKASLPINGVCKEPGTAEVGSVETEPEAVPYPAN